MIPRSVPEIEGLLHPAQKIIVPRDTCDRCGEFLPHYCAAEIRKTRQRFRLGHALEITDRDPSVTGDVR